MPSQEKEPLVLDHHQFLKHRKPKSREVSSRFLSSPSSNPTLDNVVSFPIHSPSNNLRQKPGRSSTDGRKKSSLESTGFMKGLWPSSTLSTPPTQHSSKSKNGTLAECIGNERLIDIAQRKNVEKSSSQQPFLNRQRSCTPELGRFEDEKKISKESHHKSFIGASMRYTGKFMFSRKSSNSSSSSSASSKSPNVSDDNIVPGRLSVDETALRRRRSDYLADIVMDSESDQSDQIHSGSSFPASYMSPTISSRMYGLEIPSKYLQDSATKSRRWSSESGTVQKPVSADNSPKRFSLKNAIKKSNSMKVYGYETQKLGTSPVRSNSPAGSEENKGRIMSNMKPPTTPIKVKGVGNLLTISLELFKGRKHSPGVSSPLGLGIGESVHQLRMSHSRLVQWRYANARAEVVNLTIIKQAESNLIYASNGITKLQQSVRQKKTQLEKEKLQMQLDYILRSQIKPLEAWGAMERQHQSAVNVTKDCLQSVVCKVPLVEGAKMEPQSMSLFLGAASDLTSSMKLKNSNFSAVADKTATTCRELAEIVTQEKLLLEECLELFKFISALEVQEQSLKCTLMQLKLQAEQQPWHEANSRIHA